MQAPLVDVTIAVHTESRPIARAVASVVDHTAAPVRVNVVAHNIHPALIRARLGDYADHPQVRLLELQDGIRSPAGPMNHGIAHSDAAYISVMGSDDELAPGALDSWLAIAREQDAGAVLARIRIGERTDPYPPVRRGRRTTRLDACKDRLPYRSAPLGLVNRARHGALRFTEGLPSGEDLAYSAELWFTGRNIAYDLHGPAYLVHDDAEDRVTFAPRPVEDDFAFLDEIEAQPWYRDLDRAGRRALAIKILRVHFFDAVLSRTNTAEGIGAHREALLRIVDRIERGAPGVLSLLARVDRDVIDEVRSPDSDPARILALLDARWNYRTVGAMLPRNPLLVLHPQAPFRTLSAGMRAASGA